MGAKIITGNNIRIIPRLEIKGPNLVKGINLEGLRVLGKPEKFAKYYYENGADELIYMDVVASLYGRNSLLDVINKTAQEIFIPLTVGGGIKTIEDVRLVLRAGADKVAINTAAINRPELIKEAANKFGSSTIVVSIEAIKNSEGSYEAYTENGRQGTGVEVASWAKKAVDLGAGEILITSIAQEGTGSGFDIDLIKKLAQSLPVPVIACGGAGCREHILNVVSEGKADAVVLSSILHYNFVRKMSVDKEEFSEEGNIEYLKEKRIANHVEETTLPEIKKYLIKNKIQCRYEG